MLFSSMSFIWIFLPLVLTSNLILHKFRGNKASNILLLIASIFFYAWGEPIYVLLMMISIFVNWMAGIIVSKVHKYKILVLFGTVIINLALIGYFKYSGMIVTSLNAIFGTSFVVPDIALPIGISFFTFQELSYVIDVYRQECEPQKNILKVALYVSFFPQLIAGPIVKYKDIEKQIDVRTVSTQQIAEGIRRFAYGFAKKILIANTLASAVDSIYSLGISNVTWSMAWLASLMYTFQIYYDFSGYSDMAIGLGKMFGFEFKENFNYPYTSFSIREFWRRWHISLSSWFRDYVYIPLGGSREGTRLTYRNLLIVFFLTGLWHGAGWSFVFWGLYNGIFIVIERLGLGVFLDRHKYFSWIYAFLIVNFGWVFFRIDNIKVSFEYIKCMLMPWTHTKSTYALQEFINPHTMVVFFIAIAGMGIIQRLMPKNITNKWKYSVIEIIYCTIIMFISLASIASNTYNPFIYFRF